MLTPWKESYDQPRWHIQKQRHYFANKGSSSQVYGFSSGHVWMWELDCEEGWAPKNWCFWTVVFEKTLESPLDCKEIKPINPKGNQSWIFIGMSDVEAEAPILWPPDAKSQLVEEDPDAGKDWGQEEKGTIEDKMVGWHHRLNGHEFEYTPGVGDGQGSLVCCSWWDHKESDMTLRLNNNRKGKWPRPWECSSLERKQNPHWWHFPQTTSRSLFLCDVPELSPILNNSLPHIPILTLTNLIS